MGGKSSAPAAPDPYATANAQAGYNKDTAAYNAALNRYNVNTPLGSQTWNNNGSDPITGAPIYSQTISLSPTAQANLDQNQQNSLNLSRTQGGLLGNVSSQYTRPMSTDGMPGIQSSVQGGQIQGNLPSYTNYQTGVNGGSVQRYLPTYSNFQTGVDGGPVQTGLNTSGMMNYNSGSKMDTGGLPTLPGADQDYAKQVSDSLYKQATQYLDPQFSQSKESMDADLANKGLVPGTQAYQAALTNYNNQKQAAYADARNQAVSGGVNAMNTLYGMGLSGYNAKANTALNAANVANQQAGVQNSAANSQFANALNAGQFYNTAQGQRFGQGMQNAGLYNQAQNDKFSQALQAGQFGNQGQAQQFAQGMQNASLNNSAQDSLFNQGLMSGQFGNQAQQQAYQQAYNNAALNNAASNQWLQQQMALYNQPLNTYNSLMTGSQVSMPNFQSTPAVSSQTPDYQGAVNQNYQGQLNAYNTQVGSYNSMMNGLMNLGGSAALYFSDPRLKSNVERVGTHPTGIGVYEYDIGGRRERGVMANEVERVMPDAVKTHPSGFKMVDYSKVN